MLEPGVGYFYFPYATQGSLESLLQHTHTHTHTHTALHIDVRSWAIGPHLLLRCFSPHVYLGIQDLLIFVAIFFFSRKSTENCTCSY